MILLPTDTVITPVRHGAYEWYEIAACTIHDVQYVIDCSTYHERPSATTAEHSILMHEICQSSRPMATTETYVVMLAEASVGARKKGRETD